MATGEKKTFSLGEYGYITKWLISGPYNTIVDQSTRTISDQWTYEQYLRKTAHDEGPDAVPTGISLGKAGLNGMPWRYYQAGTNSFLNASKFYPTVYMCELWAATVLCSDEEQDVAADLYSYTASAIWLNGERVFCRTESNYAPVRHERLTLHLHKGENLLFVRMQNICARDARNILGICIREKDAVRVAYPGEQSEELMRMEDAAQWLETVRYSDGVVKADAQPAQCVRLSIVEGEQKDEFEKPNGGEFLWEKETSYRLPSDVLAVLLTVCVGETELSRWVECSDRLQPVLCKQRDITQVREDLLRKVAEAPASTEEKYFVHNIYARLARGGSFCEDDAQAVREACDKIEHNHDCSDFYLTALLKMLKCEMPLPEDMKELIHR
ncbi:MAG: hypothetical protein IIV87_02885, partial [Oscillospiraceae bacterium]|nr:hypothetical protein [Oscillospiraceae bacterium]